MELNELKNIVKIKWNKFYVCKEGTSWTEAVDFGITPDEFLEFAKQDYKNKDKKGLVGAVTNSKRAIDCQIDWIISYLGYDYLNFNKEKYPNIIKMITELEKSENLSGEFPLKLRFIQVLEIAPTFLISQIREIRNELEHEYILPSEKRAKEAVEMAELFINATQNKIFNKFITNYIIQNKYEEGPWKLEIPSYVIDFNLNEHDIRIRYLIGDNKEGELRINSVEEEYIYFIKAAISYDFYYLIKAFRIDIDRKYVNYKIVEL
ncbi:hypothetical protein JW813_16735 [Clostridium botulinum]|uniref:hypothetical protein n=1 Tax=Clostridium botulinum TaxID=1491 RepID=UPI002245A8A9|nr:hypothetical protein [Clostridium botulinum]UZP03333.1 hypothetical protein JW813_16735 [Clostridium botulinum]UZP06691.1 hypothetical protein JYA71_17005 [Clostridium botulinum]UZP10072.1 hypothetical protein JYA74_16730 [Clostridium botulinum]